MSKSKDERRAFEREVEEYISDNPGTEAVIKPLHVGAFPSRRVRNVWRALYEAHASTEPVVVRFTNARDTEERGPFVATRAMLLRMYPAGFGVGFNVEMGAA